MTTSPLSIEAAAARHAEALSALFERCGMSCHCRFWHFEGTNNDWLARCAHAPDDNRAEMIDALRADSPQMRGVVAVADQAAVGWMKITPAREVRKLYAQRLYRGLSVLAGGPDGPDRALIHTIGCVLVDPGWRRRGVARSLLVGAIELARSAGAAAIEAFPRQSSELRDEEMWMGPAKLFYELGFETIHAFAPYPILRKVL